LHPLVEQTETKLDDQIISWIHTASGIVLYTLAILYALSFWGVQIAPLLASLGIAGLAVALALQPTLANIFSGIALVVDKTFEPGDIIKLDSGEVGTVYRVGLRTTRIKTFDGEVIIIPNSNIANAKLQNYNQPSRRIRATFEFGVEYGTDPEYVKKIAIEEVKKIKYIDHNEDVNILFLSMAESALTFKMMYWVNDISDKWPAKQEGMTRVYRRLYKEGIGIPFPQRTVWLREEGKAKAPSPADKKFKSSNTKFYPKFGHSMQEKTSAPEAAKKTKKGRTSGKSKKK
jgi:MscS family membrane protein